MNEFFFFLFLLSFLTFLSVAAIKCLIQVRQSSYWRYVVFFYFYLNLTLRGRTDQYLYCYVESRNSWAARIPAAGSPFLNRYCFAKIQPIRSSLRFAPWTSTFGWYLCRCLAVLYPGDLNSDRRILVSTLVLRHFKFLNIFFLARGLELGEGSSTRKDTPGSKG